MDEAFRPNLERQSVFGFWGKDEAPHVGVCFSLKPGGLPRVCLFVLDMFNRRLHLFASEVWWSSLQTKLGH